MDDFERVEVLKSSGDLQQLGESIRERVAYGAEMNPYQLRPRGIRVGFEVLYDVSILCPVVDERELERRHVDTIERQDVLVSQPLPRRHQFPKDLLCFLESLRRIDAKGFEDHILVVPSPPPDIGGSSRSDGDFPAFLKPPKWPDRIGEP